MSPVYNHLNQPVGAPVPDWTPPPWPPRAVMEGRYCRLEPLDPARHAEPLWEAFSLDKTGRNWTYLFYEPFANFAAFHQWLKDFCRGHDPLFFAIIGRREGKPLGIASYLRIVPPVGCIEVGHIHYSLRLQHTPIATEAMYLMMKNIFDLGYRRYEWKCDSLNAPSRAAAQRYGFSYEGIFRQAIVYKGRNRDTAWYAMIDSEWPALRAAFEKWLDPANFDAQGRQLLRLSDLTAPILKQIG